MSEAEDNIRSILRADHLNEPDEQALSRLEQAVEQAVVRGFQKMMNPDNAKMFWAVGIATMKEQAAIGTGNWVLGRIKGFFSSGVVWLVAAFVIWKVGGIEMAIGFLKATLSGGHT